MPKHKSEEKGSGMSTIMFVLPRLKVITDGIIGCKQRNENVSTRYATMSHRVAFFRQSISTNPDHAHKVPGLSLWLALRRKAPKVTSFIEGPFDVRDWI